MTVAEHHRARRKSTKRRFELSLSAKLGLVFTLSIVCLGAFGPFFAPHDPSEIVGSPYAPPNSAYPFGLDYVGRDALSRFLWGGRSPLVLSLLATMLGALIGVTAGVFAAYKRGLSDAIFNRSSEVFLSFPGIVLMLLILGSFGTSLTVVVVAVAINHAPSMARIARGAALEIRESPFVEVARARGERSFYIIRRELLPNILAPIGVDFGLRLATSIIAVASLSFLGLGLQPPASDWGLMISENREGLALQPWAMVPAVITIALLTVGINVLMDGARRAARVEIDLVEVQRR